MPHTKTDVKISIKTFVERAPETFSTSDVQEHVIKTHPNFWAGSQRIGKYIQQTKGAESAGRGIWVKPRRKNQ